jgi:hypothetical protein
MNEDYVLDEYDLYDARLLKLARECHKLGAHFVRRNYSISVVIPIANSFGKDNIEIVISLFADDKPDITITKFISKSYTSNYIRISELFDLVPDEYKALFAFDLDILTELNYYDKIHRE